ncbi:uncharacterized protein K460DRAFT_349987 [Cucurbitaria berberidis CBS 394.84]|uniref:C2H2-type domain-containing protein n=1 Tax=Cucurbitaria berberidis CBS 394.84 TaxID=1168544 RepID=A0A9P4GQC5_9PLEO|nr:uncharacterized protein K460DRAFT_349987 [Cucurbitaria berberidis CBS 394.84]KAF1849842.1 hypothetical protein K460DRAFT_349987 [Cucurbitaria berberidis CBS 394.84]
MLRHFGYSAADHERYLGNGQGQSEYAATAKLSQTTYPCSSAPPIPEDKDAAAFSSLESIWPASFPCINSADLEPAFSTGESLHLDPLNTLFFRNCTSTGIAAVPSVHHSFGTTWNHYPHIPIPSRQQSIIYEPVGSIGTHRAPTLSISSISGMQSYSSEPRLKDDSLSDDSCQMTESSTTSRKRSQDTPRDGRADSISRMERPLKLMRTDRHSRKRRSSGGFQGALSFQGVNLTDDQQDEDYSNLSTYQRGSEYLTAKQKKFVRHWFETFACSDSRLARSNEAMSALATLIQARPQIVYEYLNKTYPSLSNTSPSSANQQVDTPSLQQCLPVEPYVLTTANAHLPPSTLFLVAKYITACRRPRPRTDGRRSVNTGPYRCTFGCGYRTKRAFDWRRHEETHEPQEIWLCTFCCQPDGKKEPFMVSRKDKFLKHAKESHKDWMPEKVLELSKVDYRPRGDLGCPICGWKSEGEGGWDARCKHVLGHFEDEVERGLRKPRLVSVEGDGVKVSVEGSVASESVLSGGSDDEDCGMLD